MNDWLDTHAYPEGVQVQWFCLTLVGEARLWYESLRPHKHRLVRPTESIQTGIFKNTQH